MANKKFWLGILGIVLVFGMTVVGCDNDSTNRNDDNNKNGNDSNNNGDTDGTFTLTGIPSKYNGKHAILEAYEEDGSDGIIGHQSHSVSTNTFTAVRISNGSVSIPVWRPVLANDVSYVRYSDSHTFGEVYVGIINVVTFTGEEVSHENVSFLEDVILFTSVAFSNGSATRAWSAGTIVDE
jgi:hypothetical protein